MNKEDIINKIKIELDKLSDLDDKMDFLLDSLQEYENHPDFKDILAKLYEYVNCDYQEEIDPRYQEFYNVLETTNEMIINEQYEDVINLLLPYQKIVDEMSNINGIDLEQLEVGSFFNEVEKQLFYYICSDPKKDIHLLDPAVCEYYSRLGLVYHNILNYNKAYECYKKILSFNCCSNQALLGMAHLAYLQDNYLTSLEYLKEFSKYAFSKELIFEGYQLLTNIYIQLAKYDYAAIFAYIGSSFAMNEKLEETMLNIYMQYKKEINFDIDNDEEMDKFLHNEEFEYFPTDDVMDVLYTMLLDYKDHEELKNEYYDLASIITSLVDDEDLEEELKDITKEYN